MARWLRRTPRTAKPTSQTVAQPFRSFDLSQPRRGPALVTADTFLQIPAFYAAIKAKSTAVAALPLLDDDGEPLDVDPDTGTHLLARPTAHDTAFSFVDSIMNNLAIHGNAFVLPTRVSMTTGAITETEVVHPDYITPRWSYDGTQRTYEQGAWLDGIELGPQDYIHLKDLTHGGYAWGVSPLRVLAHTLGRHASELGYLRSMWDDGLQPAGYWHRTRRADPQLAQRESQAIADAMGGRGHSVSVVPEELEWVTTALKPSDVQMLASRQWSTAEACQIVGVPPHLVGAVTYDSETYANARMDMAMFESVTLVRYTRTISETLRQHGIRFGFGRSELGRPTELERAQAAAQLVQAGIQSPAQAAAQLGLPAPDTADDTDSRLASVIAAGAQSMAEADADV